MTYTGTITVADPMLVETITDLPEGYTGYVRVDESPESPREWDGNVSVLVQTNDRRGSVDSGDDLSEAHYRWDWTNDRGFFGYMPSWFHTDTNRALHRVGREALMARYLRIFRPDIKHYVERWDAGRDLYGWGYITTEAWDAAGCTATPEEVFDAEVDIYRQWADGEVYGVTVVHEESGEEASLWGVYDEPFGYVRDVALDLIEEIKP